MHIIQKTIFDLKISEESEAFEIQQRVSRVFWRELMPRMNLLFDELCIGNEHISIDLLELDLGNITEKTLSSDDFISLFLKILKENLSQKISIQDKTVLKMPYEQYIFEEWLFFLQNGYVSRKLKKMPEKWQETIYAKLASDTYALEKLAELLRQENTIQRLILQYNSIFLQQILGIYTAQNQSILPSFLLILLKFRKEVKTNFKNLNLDSSWLNVIWRIENSRDFELFFWEWAIHEVVLKQQKISSKEIITIFFNQYFTKQGAIFFSEWVNKKESKKPISDSNIENILREIIAEKGGKYAEISEKYTPSNIEYSKSLKNKNEKLVPNKSKIQDIDNQDIRMNNGASIDSQMIDNFNKNISKDECLFTDFAGIVLINPFLKDLFLKLKYISEGQFMNEAKQNRAVHLVHFISGGQLQAPEYEQVLSKILCGMPLEKPLDVGIKLTKKETNEAEKMMEAAISWWGAIGNTTPDGLREGFLKREGKIKQTDMGWELFVQPQTVDIMLQQLPFGWGISFIKLSWMKKILTVDWQ